MKIRIRYFLLILFLTLTVGYIVGTLWPIDMLSISVLDTPISKGDHRANLIGIFVAFFTMLAVIVALFKDEIQGCFKRVDLIVAPINDSIIEELEDNISTTGDPKVSKYYNGINITNKGNINALDCEIAIEKLYFIGGEGVQKEINLSNKELTINNNTSAYISSMGQKSVMLYEITYTESPDKTVLSSILKIGNNTMNYSTNGGEWNIICQICMKNAKPVKKQIQIKWDGKWRNRMSEMVVTTNIIDIIKH